MFPDFQQYLRDAGRDPVGLSDPRCSLVASDDGPDAWLKTALAYRDAGVTHLTLTAPPGLSTELALKRVVEARAHLVSGLS